MIKIDTPNISNIASNYFDSIKIECLQRCEFYVKVIHVLKNPADYPILKADKMHGSLKKSLINQLLTRNKLTNQTSYHNVNPGNCDQPVLNSLTLFGQIVSYLSNFKNLELIILCRPQDSKLLHDNIKAHFGMQAGIPVLIKSFINKIIDYSIFDDYAYDVAISLAINTCPYCNRNFITTVVKKNGKGIIRPTFDHFFSQVDYPFLALSFYNLVPSCYPCNSNIKGSKPVDIDTHIHPYIEGFGNDAKFNFQFINCKANLSDPDNYVLSLEKYIPTTNPKHRKIFGDTAEEGNVNLFELVEIYQTHRDVVGEIVLKCRKYSNGYADSLYNIFGLLNTNKIEFYQYYFANYFNENDFLRRPLAKLTKDIVQKEIPNF